MVKFVSDLLETLRGKGIKAEYLRCDNTDEHISKLINLCQKEGIELYYTPTCSPRKNDQFEEKLNLIRERAMTIMVHGKLKK